MAKMTQIATTASTEVVNLREEEEKTVLYVLFRESKVDDFEKLELKPNHAKKNK